MPDEPTPEAVHVKPAGSVALLTISWLWVGVPLVWGVWGTVRSSLALFH
jgi:hypothetical protein